MNIIMVICIIRVVKIFKYRSFDNDIFYSIKVNFQTCTFLLLPDKVAPQGLVVRALLSRAVMPPSNVLAESSAQGGGNETPAFSFGRCRRT